MPHGFPTVVLAVGDSFLVATARISALRASRLPRNRSNVTARISALGSSMPHGSAQVAVTRRTIFHSSHRASPGP